MEAVGHMETLKITRLGKTDMGLHDTFIEQ